MNRTPIEWVRTYAADGTYAEGYSVNPIRFWPKGNAGRSVTMCQKVSPGCAHCYAEGITRRFWPKESGPFPGYTALGVVSGDFVLSEKALLSVLKHKKPARVFWGDMTDLFQESVPDEMLDQCFAVAALTPQLTHMFLTKRPERMRKYLSNDYLYERWLRAADTPRVKYPKLCGIAISDPRRFPLPNVWLGVSVENQKAADERIPLLLETPAAVRFLSVEPLLGPVDLKSVRRPSNDGRTFDAFRESTLDGRYSPHLDWVIVGGESGPGARPMHPDWARGLRDQCVAAGVPFFFKQWGEWCTGEQIQKEHGIKPGSIGPERVNWVMPDGRSIGVGQGGAEGFELCPGNLMTRVGKKAAGRLLDGREWDQFPEVRR